MQGGSFDPSRSRNDKMNNLTAVEEEIKMSNLGAPPAGSQISNETLKGDMSSERSSGSIDGLELGNQTHVEAAGENFSWSGKGGKNNS